MNRLWFIPCVLLVSIPTVLAVPPPPAPVCHVIGTVEDLTFEEGYASCLRPGIDCPTDSPIGAPDRYRITVTIKSVSYVSGETGFVTCERLYPVGSQQEIFLKKENVKQGDVFEKGQTISGRVSRFFDKTFETYNLERQDNGGIIIGSAITIVVLMLIFGRRIL